MRLMNKNRILIVEDDAFLRDIYVEILTQEGYSVETAVDGEQGLEKVRAGGWDLILMDIILPKMDGLEIMKKVKSEKTDLPNKAVVFLTNLDSDEQIKEALKYGEGYFIKSQLTPDNLLKEVSVYLKK